MNLTFEDGEIHSPVYGVNNLQTWFICGALREYASLPADLRPPGRLEFDDLTQARAALGKIDRGVCVAMQHSRE